MALHHKLQAVAGKKSNIMALAAEPGYSVTPLQTTSTFMPSWMDSNLFPRQSAADGSLPAAMACFSPQCQSGDMLAPEKGMVGKPVWTIRGGEPVRKGTEKLSCNEANQKVAWEACEKGLGVSFGL